MKLAAPRPLALKPAWVALAGYAAVVAAITGAWWLRPGYVWLLDGVWGPRRSIDWTHSGGQWLWQVVITGTSHIFTPPVAQKLILSLVLLGVALAGYMMARKLLPPLWAGLAGLLYLLNPFVYERLLAGQWIVLAGYALLPVAVALMYELLESHGRRSRWPFVAVVAAYPLVSPHFAYIAAWLLAAMLATYIALHRPGRPQAGAIIKTTALALGAALAINAWWLLRPHSGSAWPTLGPLDLANFRTAVDPQFGLWPNLLALYGFWRGPAFFEPKDLISWWWLIALVMLVATIFGLMKLIRTRPYLGITLSLAAITSVFLAAGYSSSLSRPVVMALFDLLPGFSGLRDTGKFIGVLALIYAVCVPLAAHQLAGWLRERWAGLSLAAMLAVLSIISVTGIWGGYNGQVTVADYPAGWYQAKAKLPPTATSVVLPWHGYLRLDFAHAYTAQPASVFFPGAILASHGFDNPLYDRAPEPLDRLMWGLTTGTMSPVQWAAQLKNDYSATHVIVIKTDDWQPYAARLTGSAFPVVFDDPTITIYRLPQ